MIIRSFFNLVIFLWIKKLTLKEQILFTSITIEGKVTESYSLRLDKKKINISIRDGSIPKFQPIPIPVFEFLCQPIPILEFLKKNL